MDPLISVVIPVFNRASIISEAISSCIEQTYPHIEVILVDDCSGDDLDAALQPWQAEPKVKLVRHQQNLGVSAARNTGVEAAGGEYVAFLDSDDAWLPTKLERQIDLASRQGSQSFIIGTLTEVVTSTRNVQIRPKMRKSLDMSLGDYLFVHKAQKRLQRVSYDKAPLIGGCFAQTSSYLLPRALASATPFRVDLRQYEDMAFLIDLDAKGTEFLLVEEPLTVQHNDDRLGRLGAQDDLARGRQFLQAIGGSLSPEARLSFETGYLGHLLWRESPLNTLRMIARAFFTGAIGPKNVLGILSRCLLGQTSQKTLRHAIRTLLGRSAGQAI